MIRPSLLGRARKCGYVVTLSELHPETSEAASKGTAIHAEIAAWIQSGAHPASDEAKSAVEWVESRRGGFDTVTAEKRATLTDPETSEVITDGTADLVLVSPDSLIVADWKTGLLANVEDVNTNAQIRAYGAAVALELGRESFVPLVLGFQGGGVIERWGSEVTDLWPIIEEAKTLNKKDRAPTIGDHCVGCYQRHYCEAWTARASVAVAVMQSGAVATMTDDQCSKLSERISQVEDALEAAKAMRLAHVKGGGCCVVNEKKMIMQIRNGRESADVKAIKAAGLIEYIKIGKEYETTAWIKNSEVK